MKRYIKANYEPLMHRLAVHDEDGNVQIKHFDSYTKLSNWLSENGYDDPTYFLDENSPIYLEHVPRYDAEEKDPSWAEYVKTEIPKIIKKYEHLF